MSKEKTVIVNNRKTGIIGFESIVLMPGANMVPESIVKNMQGHPVIKAMVEEGTLEFPEGISEEKGISELSQAEAVDLAVSTVDVELLSNWKKTEKRKPVLKAIDEQLKKLAEPAVLRDGKKQENE